MAILLNALYEEYKELKQKLDKVSDLIISYGGKPPVIRPTSYLDRYETETGNKIEQKYPSNGTWKDKIYFILRSSGKLTNREVSDMLYKYESEIDRLTDMKHIYKTVTLYLSTMAIANEILVDKSEPRKYKYSYKA